MLLLSKADVGGLSDELLRSVLGGTRKAVDAVTAKSAGLAVLLGCTCAATIAGLVVRSKLAEPVYTATAQLRSIEEEKKDKAKKQRGFSMKAVPEDLDAIVVGSGAGGLACAVTLAKQGKRVLVLEQHDVAGGCTHTFTQDGYEFDSGLHYIGGEIWNPAKGGRVLMDFVTDGAVQWHRTGEVCDVSVIAGERMEVRASAEQLRAALKERFPAEEAVVDRYFEAVEESQGLAGLYFAHKIIPSCMKPPLEKIMRRPYVSRFAGRTTLEVLKSIGASEELIGKLCFFWGDYGLPPAKSSFALHAMVAQHYISGGAYPVGGPSVIARSACRIIEEHGGAVLVRAPVEEVLVDPSGRALGVRVDRSGGVEVLAPIVVSAVGATATYTKLLPEHLRPAELAQQAGKLRVPQSCAHLSLFIGIRGDNAELNLPSSNLWASPSADHDGNAEAWYSLEPTEEALEAGDFAAVFITFPSAKDPSWPQRHPGKSTCHIIAEAPYRWFEQWRDTRLHHRGESYQALKRLLTKKLMAKLLEHFPQCEGRVEVCELGTPLSSEYYLGSSQGASYGLMGTPERYCAEWIQPRTTVRGLYLTGQDIVSAGVMGALCSGFLTALSVDPKIAWSQLRVTTSL